MKVEAFVDEDGGVVCFVRSVVLLVVMVVVTHTDSPTDDVLFFCLLDTSYLFLFLFDGSVVRFDGGSLVSTGGIDLVW